MAWRNALLDESRTSRQRQGRLRNVVGRIGENARAESFDLLLGRGRADQHAVAARALYFLHDQRGKVVHRFGEISGFFQLQRGHVLEDRFLAQVKADHVRDIGVGRFVVGHASSERIREAHIAGAVHRQQARHTEIRIRAKRERIEESVVDTPVNDVDALASARGAHEDVTVLHEQIRAFDEFDPHLLREKSMLEIRAVGLAGREHHYSRFAHCSGRRRTQCVQQQRGIVLHRQNRLGGEQLGKQPHHHFAVLEHVRNAGGRAQVVLQHVIAAIVMPDQVDAGDMRVDAVGQLQPDHRDLIGVVGEHMIGWDHAGLEDRLVVIDVVQETVQRADALGETFGEHLPFGARNDARDRVERDQPLGAGLIAIHRERNADPMEQQVGLSPLLGDALGRHACEPLYEVAIMLPHPAPNGAWQVHLVVMLGSCGHGAVSWLAAIVSNARAKITGLRAPDYLAGSSEARSNGDRGGRAGAAAEGTPTEEKRRYSEGEAPT